VIFLLAIKNNIHDIAWYDIALLYHISKLFAMPNNELTCTKSSIEFSLKINQLFCNYFVNSTLKIFNECKSQAQNWDFIGN
jgi:hypothetical protein